MRTIILALLLLWLCLSGGFAGWNSALLAYNLVFWIGLMLWLIWQAGRIKPGLVDTGIVFFILTMLISTALNDNYRTGLLRVGVWLGYLGFYYLAQTFTDREIQQAGLLALLPYVLFVPLARDNANVLAFHLLGLALLAMPLDWPILPWAMALLVNPLGCVGGILSGLLAALHRLKIRWQPLTLSLSLSLLLGGWLNPAGYEWRLHFWSAAWQQFSLSPLWGIGRYELQGYWHAHNTAVTVAVESGLIGLAGLGLLVWAIARRWPALPGWAAAVVLAYGAWSLVDEPLHFWGAAFIFFLALSRQKGNDSGFCQKV